MGLRLLSKVDSIRWCVEMIETVQAFLVRALVRAAQGAFHREQPEVINTVRQMKT